MDADRRDLVDATPDSPGWFGFLPAAGAGAALVAYLFLLAFPLMAEHAVPLAAPLAAVVFGALQLAFPASRPTPQQLVSPRNWAVFVFFLKLIVMPLVIAIAGPTRGLLPHLPSARAIELSITLDAGAFAAFTIAFASVAGRARAMTGAEPMRVSAVLPLVFAALGIAGLVLGFGSIGGAIARLADPGRYLTSSAHEATLEGAAGTFLRPFLLNGIVLAWSMWADRRGPESSWPTRATVTVVVAVAVIAVGATYAFNRASFLVPLVAIIAGYSSRVRRIGIPSFVAIACVCAVLAIVPAQYRKGTVTAAELARSSAAREDLLYAGDLSAQLQIYGNAPQFAAYLIEAAERTYEPITYRVLIGSVLTPVPILGKGVREVGGPAVYNRLVYGNIGVVDQVIPFEGEIYLALGPVGLVAAFALLGVGVARLQGAFERAPNAFDAYALQYIAVWLLFLVQGSLAAISQVFVYFCWPLYAYAALRWWRGWTSRRALAFSAATPGVTASRARTP